MANLCFCKNQIMLPCPNIFSVARNPIVSYSIIRGAEEPRHIVAYPVPERGWSCSVAFETQARTHISIICDKIEPSTYCFDTIVCDAEPGDPTVNKGGNARSDAVVDYFTVYSILEGGFMLASIVILSNIRKEYNIQAMRHEFMLSFVVRFISPRIVMLHRAESVGLF